MTERAASSVSGSADARWRARLLPEDGSSGAPLSPREAAAFAAFALERVSRTFALNIRVLPDPLRGRVLHAYLYCRMADTVEDDATLPAPVKSALLRAFAALFAPEIPPASRAAMARGFVALLPASWRASREWEHVLLARAPEVIAAFSSYPAAVRAALGTCVETMCAGMADFAMRQDAVAQRGGALVRTVAELDRYCWFVAGTVGVMLGELFIRHGAIAEPHAGRMRALCVSFGTGLQLVNILKDLADDRARGVSWLPEDLLAAHGLSAADFGDPAHAAASARVHAALFAKTRRHLDEALEYTLAIPRRHRRLRLFCLWPLLMAAETLALLAENAGAVAGGARLKMSRARVARIVRLTGLFWWSETWLRAEFGRLAARVERAA